MSAKKSPQQQREYKLSDGTDMVEYQNKTAWNFTGDVGEYDYEDINEGLPRYTKSDIELIGMLIPKANVVYLSLGMNQIQDISALKDCLTNVTRLELNDNKIVDISPLKNSLPNVTKLQLGGNQIQDISPLRYSIPNVTELFLEDNQIQDISPLRYSIPNVTELWLENNNIEDISALKNSIPKVTLLDLQCNKIQDISALKNSIPKVTLLDLYGNKIQDISALKNSMPKVTYLHLQVNQIEDISALKDSMPNVTKLWLHNNNIAPVSKEEFKAHWKSLGKDEDNLCIHSIYTEPTLITDELANFLGKPHGTEITLNRVIDEIKSYIRANSLRDLITIRRILADDALSELLRLTPNDELTYFNLQKFMRPHFAKGGVLCQ